MHHLNCGTMCPFGAGLLAGRAGLLDRSELVVHCLLVEAGGQLVLVDTGFGTGDVADPNRLGRPARRLIGPRCDPEETAVGQIEALGLDPRDVRHIVVTHLDLDHAGGLGDFPEAEVHVFAPELAAAEAPSRRDRARYVREQWAHGPRWAEHEVNGESWFGFESVSLLPGVDVEVALVPLVGHSRGHSAVALNTGAGWLLHCGDAYFHHGEVETPVHCPQGLRIYQSLVQHDGSARQHNRERLRELAAAHPEEVRLVCSHDPAELERERGR